MNKEEINTIIAEFEFRAYETVTVHKDSITGLFTIHYKDDPSYWVGTKPGYTDSLDSLIPVVEKLPVFETRLAKLEDNNCWTGFIQKTSHSEYWICHDDTSPSMALATACAETIKEL